jgi:hypothetical protein
VSLIRHAPKGLFWLACFCLFGSIISPVKSADLSAEASPQVELTGDQAFGMALQLLIRAKDYQKAYDLLMSRPYLLERPEGARLQAELLFRLGKIDAALAVIELYLSATPEPPLPIVWLWPESWSHGENGSLNRASKA